MPYASLGLCSLLNDRWVGLEVVEVLTTEVHHFSGVSGLQIVHMCVHSHRLGQSRYRRLKSDPVDRFNAARETQ